MKYYLAFVVLVFISCQDVKRPEMPEDLIPQEKMVSILAEAYLINAARSFDNRTIREKGMKLDSFLYRKYEIDSLQFAKSNDFYTANLNDYNNMFENVEARLLLMKKEADSLHIIYKEKKEAKRKQDSIDGIKGDSIVEEIKAIENPQLIDPQESHPHQ